VEYAQKWEEAKEQPGMGEELTLCVANQVLNQYENGN